MFLISSKSSAAPSQRAPHQRLGLRKAVRGAEQCGEIGEVSHHLGMIRPVARLGDGQRAPHQRLGLRKAVRGAEQCGEIGFFTWQ